MIETKLVQSELDEIRRIWRTLVSAQMDKSCDELHRLQPWQFFEAMQYLVDAICTYFDMLIPIGASFCFMNSVEEPCQCELLLAWNMLGTKAPGLGAHSLIVGKFMRLDEFPWPGRRVLSLGPTPKLALTETIQSWAHRLSVVKDILEGKKT